MAKGAFSQLNELADEYGMLPKGCTVLCAVSGGADSIYLLHRLYLLRDLLGFRLVAAHYNHGLRGEESRRDEAFVRDFVASWCGEMRIVEQDGGECVLPPVELIVGQGDVAAEARRRKAGLEETARSMRYAFLEEAAHRVGADRIAVAHTADDNAETLLLHLLRGTGLRGLAGMEPVRGRVIRPMLTTTRKTVMEYLTLYGIPHVEDSSNEENFCLRNRLRHRVMPVLEELAPGFVERSRDTARFLRGDEEQLCRLADGICEQAVWEGEQVSISAALLADAPESAAVRAVRRLLGQLRGGDDRFSSAHLCAVLELCRSCSPSARTDLPDGLAAWREYERLCLGPDRPPPPVEEQTVEPPCRVLVGDGWLLECESAIRPEQSVKNDGFFYLDRAKLRGALLVRSRKTGDELALPGRPVRSLKKLLIDRRLPRRLRDSLPVLADETGVLAVAGLGPDGRRLAGPGEAALKIRFLRMPRREEIQKREEE